MNSDNSNTQQPGKINKPATIRPREIVSKKQVEIIAPGIGMDHLYFTTDNSSRKTRLSSPTTNRNGPDNVIWLFPSAGGGAEWYSYGVVEPNEFHEITLNNQIIYKNGNLGIYNEFAVYPNGGKFQNTLIYDYKYRPTPEFLYNQRGIKNHEMTVYLKVKDSDKNNNNGYKSVRFRMRGRDEPDKRSAIEVWCPTSYNQDVLMNTNYSAIDGNKSFIRSVRQFTNLPNSMAVGIIKENKWIGFKYVDMVAHDNSYMWIGLYIDYDNNNDFKLLADCIFTPQQPAFNNVLPTWRGHKDSIIVEGYESVEFYNVSDREIDVSAIKPLHTSHLTVNEFSNTFRSPTIPTKLILDNTEAHDVWEKYNT